MTPAATIRHFHAQLRALGDPTRAAAEQAYMKTTLRFHGVRVPTLRRVCAEYCAANTIDAPLLRATVDALFATDWFDLRTLAIALLERKRALLVAGDERWLVELVRKGACWGHVDYIATQVIDPLLVAHPRLLAKTRTWAKDDDFWVRRTALLAQLGPLRRGAGDFALFASIAEPMLEEKEFFIRKAIGWVLREVSKKRPALVRDFLRQHGARASGLTRREGMKYLPAAMQKELASIMSSSASPLPAPPPPRSPGSRRARTRRAPAGAGRNTA